MSRRETNTTALQVGILAITAQRASNAVHAWLEAEGKAGRPNSMAKDAPGWEAYEVATAAYRSALTAAVMAMSEPDVTERVCGPVTTKAGRLN